MEAIIKKWGNSLGVRLPINMTKEMNIEDGSKIEIMQKNNKIIISVPDSTIDMDFLTSGMTVDGVLEQFEDYPSLGLEE